TGDIGFEAMRLRPDVHVTGVDFTHEMMLVGQRKADREGLLDVHGSRLRFADADTLSLPFPDATFDAVCSGFLMRNVSDIARAFAEQRRVVKPGGRVVCLEITRPQTPLWRDLFGVYFFRLVPLIGSLLSGERQAYTYLPHSTLAFPLPQALKGIMEGVGLRRVRYKVMMLGTVALHVGEVSA
ncbi:MAG: class I SAM-dependent methyltransferase, partial [Anaerolineae bacterium]